MRGGRCAVEPPKLRNVKVDAEIYDLVMRSRPVHDRTARRLDRLSVPDREKVHQCLLDGLPVDVWPFGSVVVTVDADGFTVSGDGRSVRRNCGRLLAEREVRREGAGESFLAMLAEVAP